MLTTCPYFYDIKFDVFDPVVLSATSSPLYYVQGRIKWKRGPGQSRDRENP